MTEGWRNIATAREIITRQQLEYVKMTRVAAAYDRAMTAALVPRIWYWVKDEYCRRHQFDGMTPG